MRGPLPIVLQALDEALAGRLLHSASRIGNTVVRPLIPGITQDDTHQRDARELFRRMVFNILVDNTDDHEKNHALLVVDLHRNGRLKLAPAYDVLPSNSGQGFQEFICGSHGRDATLDNAMSQCDAFGLLPA